MKKKTFFLISILCIIIVLFIGCGNKQTTYKGSIPDDFKFCVAIPSNEEHEGTLYYLDEKMETVGELVIPYTGFADVFSPASVKNNQFTFAPQGLVSGYEHPSMVISLDITNGKAIEGIMREKYLGIWCSASNTDAFFLIGNLNGVDYIFRRDKKSQEVIEMNTMKKQYKHITADDKYLYAFSNDSDGIGSWQKLDTVEVFNQKDLTLIKEIPLNNCGLVCHSAMDNTSVYFTYNEDNEELSFRSQLGILNKDTLTLEFLELGEIVSAMIEISGEDLYVAHIDVIGAMGTKVTKFHIPTLASTSYEFNHNISEIRISGNRCYAMDFDHENNKLFLYEYEIQGADLTLIQSKYLPFIEDPMLYFGSFFIKEE